MELLKVKIENFKCIEDSTEFNIDDITCLLGKNEAGKSAILQALYKLNPVQDDEADFEQEEFPRRHLARYRVGKQNESVNVLTTTWKFEGEDVDYVNEKIGIDCVSPQEIIIKKGYDNVLYIDVDYNEKIVVEKIMSEAKLDDQEREKLKACDSIKTLREELGVPGTPNTPGWQELNQRLQKKFPKGFERLFLDLVKQRLPKFLYFTDYDCLPGRMSINSLQVKKQQNKLEMEDKIFLALLSLASSTPESIINIKESEKLIMELETISNLLTEEIFEYWTQNKHLDVDFRCDPGLPGDPPPFNSGFVFSTRIKNRRHRVTVNFDERSTGFIWFFSFLIWFSQIKNEYDNNVILLLDEPGLSLHGTAQRDLLRYFEEKLRPYYQLIYTTHSPFMLDPTHIFSIRTIEDVVEKRGGREEIKGTKVSQRILSREPDTILPIQGIAGFEIAQTMFVGPYVLVVEGPSEAGYINWFSRQLIEKKRDGLDIRWAICPAESASKVSSFVSLFKGRGLKIAVLMDFHKGEKKNVTRLENSGLLDPGYLLKTTDFVDGSEADIEDLVGWKVMTQLVNRALGLRKKHKLPLDRPEGTQQRVMKEIDDLCRILPSPYPELNHFTPVEELLALDKEEISELEGLDSALDRFERLFKKFNALI